ncbi:MAG: hypothetical protein ACR2OA_11490 [Rubripirellula sp.]|jgi:hypothetical protein
MDGHALLMQILPTNVSNGEPLMLQEPLAAMVNLRVRTVIRCENQNSLGQLEDE